MYVLSAMLDAVRSDAVEIVDLTTPLDESTPILEIPPPFAGSGVDTVGTDAGQAPALEPAFPCHSALMGANKWGLTSLRNLDKLPPTGTVLVVAPLPIVGGSGSPARVLALSGG